MTFFTSSTPSAVTPPVGLSQSGRAGLEFLGALQKFSSGPLRKSARRRFFENPEGAALRDMHLDAAADRNAMLGQIERARTIAEGDPLYRLERFNQAYVANDIWNRAIVAIEERREVFEPMAAISEEPRAGKLELDHDLIAPLYHSEVEWHLEPGGWDGYDLYGPAFAFGIGPLVFRHGGYAAVSVGADIVQQRRDAIRQLPKPYYKRIYEPGCGGVSTALAIREVFPDAEIVGSDLSPLLLKNGRILADKLGIEVTLKQRDAAVATGEPDESFDAVVTYALHHELPPKANRSLFVEMYRILKPGGDIVMSDPPPFRAVDPFHAAVLDWDTRHRGEPFFRTACLTDWKEELRAVGFIDVEDYAIGEDSYPWITRARKPL